MMRLPCAFGFAGLFLLSAKLQAHIGETSDQLDQRYGSPTKAASDANGYGMRVYQDATFREIRVTMVAGKSYAEKYLIREDATVPAEVLTDIRSQPLERPPYETDKEIFAGPGEPEDVVKYGKRSGELRTVTGTASIKDYDKMKMLVVRDPTGTAVVEALLRDSDRFAAVVVGKHCSVTVADEASDDINARIAVVGRREHVDWHDCVDDAHSNMHRLAAISIGDRKVFDEWTCEVHGLRTQLRSVPISYGMMGLSDEVQYCDEHFPHWREFAAGGCIADEKNRTRIFICDRCVDEARRHLKANATTARN